MGKAEQFLLELGRNFPAVIRERGQSYQRRGQVDLRSAVDGEVRAIVRGSEPYSVRLGRDRQNLSYRCTCPFFLRERTPCKHVWAVVAELSARGSLHLVDNGSPLRVVVDKSWRDAVDFAEDGEDDELGLSGEFDLDDEAAADAAAGAGLGSGPRQSPTTARPRSWREVLGPPSPAANWRAQQAAVWARREVLYVVDLVASRLQESLLIEVGTRERLRDGSWGAFRPRSIAHEEALLLSDPLDREILARLAGAESAVSAWQTYPMSQPRSQRYRLGPLLHDSFFPSLARTGRLRLGAGVGSGPLTEVGLETERWDLTLVLEPAPTATYRLVARLERDEERLAPSALQLLFTSGWFLAADRFGRLRDAAGVEWLQALRQGPFLEVPGEEVGEWLAAIYSQASRPRLDLPPELAVERPPAAPTPRLALLAAGNTLARRPAALLFDYDGQLLAPAQREEEIFSPVTRRLNRRDLAIEAAAHARLVALGLRHRGPSPRPYWEAPGADWSLEARELPAVLTALLAAGWQVTSDGKRYRSSSAISLQLSSGTDWFDLSAHVEFDGQAVPLPALLAAAERRETAIRLDDGSLGLLPAAWLARQGWLLALGEAKGERLRFSRSQVALLDALLEDDPAATVDATFRRAREKLASFHGVQPLDPPSRFVGELRPYQREGLGWLRFLADFGFGGCLADDMGLGKTVQVLALLAGRRRHRKQDRRPSLVVAPRSVIFNWLAEAQRFTPHLTVLEHHGPLRDKSGESFAGYDLVVTTYALLRDDVALLTAQRWDYAILDEAQAIKNAGTQSAKAARLLRANHRLALSGTPIENHLGELWSLFDFLNPGMLGRSLAFEKRSSRPDEAGRALLARAIAPFVLRRTKEQVLHDLPKKSQQTLFCDLDTKQRRLYNELKRFYQASLLRRIDSVGLAKSKIQVLEALLRLRQAACHPGLVDPKRGSEPSAKLDALLPLVAEVLEGGHKALVFSQFTSFLALFRRRLDERAVPYAYLDGRTRDRQAIVERFQTDPACPLFLISLKAGGLGLNLTAADYVFLLDPWWNPAVEAQAIDRAHRLGQTRPVLAYRLVARETIEEKILALQESKVELAESILSADSSLIRQLTRDDLGLLLA